MKIWNWLSGKKTSIGAVILAVCAAPHADKYIGSDILDILWYAGVLISGGGISHRIFKQRKGDMSDEERSRKSNQ